ncbi:MAG: MBL fold metallo-hydrolase [Bryobacteraceae bacterium]|jgi:glyoxylase-like metal-dependent hydrolase (beta-lactamase superfamily II)
MRLSNRCFAITGLGYLPPWTVNAGFITGDETTLVVDTGANAAAASTIHGYASIARPSNRIRVLDTERHFDHVGGNAYFRERGIEVYGHASIQRTDHEFREEISEFNAEISNPARRARQESEVFYLGTRLANPNCPIAEDSRMSLGACEIDILLTPGHTPSNISVYVPSDGVLFCGDCLVNGYLPNLDAGSILDWSIWLKSLDRVAALAPRVVVPGHGPVATGDDVPRLIESVREVLHRSIEAGTSPTS